MDSWVMTAVCMFVSHVLIGICVCVCVCVWGRYIYQVCLTLMSCPQFCKFSNPISTLKVETQWEKVWLLKWKDKGQDSGVWFLWRNSCLKFHGLLQQIRLLYDKCIITPNEGWKQYYIAYRIIKHKCNAYTMHNLVKNYI